MKSAILTAHSGVPAAGSTAGLAVLVAAWFGVAVAAALAGAFDAPPGRLPWATLTALVAPIAAYVAAYRLSPRLRELVQSCDLRPLVLLHTFRMLGVAFLILAAFGVLPLVFAVPAGVGDAAAALGALALGVALYRPRGVSRRLVAAWNVLGLADFVVAVAIGVLSRDGALLHLPGSVASDAMGSFPLAVIPAFVVPLYVITHLVVLAQLRTRWAGSERIHFGARERRAA